MRVRVVMFNRGSESGNNEAVAHFPPMETAEKPFNAS